jgi:Domain of unknown function (DUF929)
VTILASVAGVAVLIAVIAVIAITHKSTPAPGARTAASPTILSDVTGVSDATLKTVGLGSATASQKPISDPPLTSGGKPELLYVGAEFCPFCAAERWSMIQALSRFGTFSNVSEITSSEDSLPTFSFHKSSYTSKYLTFTPVEDEDQKSQPLEKLTSAQNTLFTKDSQGSFPFLYFGGKFYQSGAGYDNSLLSGKTHAQVASALNTPGSSIAKGIDGEANKLTALICSMTKNQPATVCSSSTITSLQGQLNG